MTIEEKKARVYALDDQVRGLQQECSQLKQEITDEEAPIKVGEWLEWNAGRTRRKGRVKRVIGGGYATTGNVSRYIVEPLLKSGKLGAPVDAYTWDSNKVEKVDAPC